MAGFRTFEAAGAGQLGWMSARRETERFVEDGEAGDRLRWLPGEARGEMDRRLPALLVVLALSGCPESPESGQPAARFEPEQLDLGRVVWAEQRPASQRLVLFNTGEVPLRLESLEAPGGWSVASTFAGSPIRIDPGVGLAVSVEFVGQPSADALHEAEVTACLTARGEGFSAGLTAVARLSLEVDCDGDDDGHLAEACGGADCDDLDPERSPATVELCNGLPDGCGELPSDEEDHDGDGFLACAECDDARPSVHPGAAELCDGLDTDCDPATSAPGGEEDFDTDGFLACAECDDLAHHNAPGNVEVCDGLDNDCDGAPAPEEVDDDGDGQTECDGDCDDADPTRSRFLPEACNAVDDDCDGVVPGDELDLDGDGFLACAECDDGAGTTFPGASELCNGVDDDCDGALPADELDADLDGFLACAECDDGAGTTFPGAPELCNGVDDDCDGALPADELDADLDGFLACADCDDGAGATFPGAPELCNGLDDDCDGSVPEGEEDADTDGFLACAECDDAASTTFPGASELCNEVDDDCDGVVPPDEADSDADGHLACAECDDGVATTFPGAPELCNGVDDDCDGALPTDELDGDADGFAACAECDDLDPSTFPGAPELCDGLDNDCDPSSLESVDDDGDGFDECSGDCDDGDGEVWPGRPEEQCDGLDEDCDGAVDEGYRRVPEDHSTIQEALDLRSTGDVICLAPGEYEEELTIQAPRSAAIVGWAGSAETALVGANYSAGPIVHVPWPGPAVSLEGLTLRHAGWGLLQQSGSLELTDVVFSDLAPTSSGSPPVSVYSSTVTLTDVSFIDIAAFAGGAVSISGSEVVGTGVEVRGCSGGAALSFGQNVSVVLEDFIVEDNPADIGLGIAGGESALSHGLVTGGGSRGIYKTGASWTIDEVVVADQGGPGLFVGADEGFASHLVVADNCQTWVTNCAGMMVAGAQAEVSDVAVTGNHDEGLRALGGVDLLLSSSSIVGNVSAGLRLTGEATVTASGVEISSNGCAACNLSPSWGVLNATSTNVWGNTLDFDAPVAFTPGLDGNLAVDPQYLDVSSSDPLDWDLHLAPTSPLIDAGDPSLSDPDGSPADIGAFGGPWADQWDLDGDGWPSWWQPGPYDSATHPALGLDCDDLDPAVGPDDC